MPIRVLVTDDSPTMRYHLASLITEAADMEVIGQARNGEEALSLAQQTRPDVISMDIRMPGMDGLEATRRIMTECPTPVVVVSGLLDQEVDLSMQALQAGALAVVEKPPDRGSPVFAEKQRNLLRTLRAMAGVKVVGRRALLSTEGVRLPSLPSTASLPALVDARPITSRLRPVPQVIVIGASAGGPSALVTLLGGLPATLSVPICIVQHMPHEFVNGLARWLQKSSPLEVTVAKAGAALRPGVVYLAPGTAHLAVARAYDDRLIAQLIEDQGSHRYRPAINVLFSSAAAVCGAASVGILLTGMGDDGADGLLAMRQAGARTIAQDQTSATVFGMPGAAVERGAVEQVVSLSKISLLIRNIV